jgi:peptidyl-tRNA hydrolase, PTH2 family
MELIQYIVINTSLGMGKGKIAAQASHASVLVLDKIDEKKVKKWKENGMKKIVLKANAEEFIKKFQELKDKELDVAMIRDAGRTQIDSGSKTAFACGPIDEEEGEKYFSEMKLL